MSPHTKFRYPSGARRFARRGMRYPSTRLRTVSLSNRSRTRLADVCRRLFQPILRCLRWRNLVGDSLDVAKFSSRLLENLDIQ